MRYLYLMLTVLVLAVGMWLWGFVQFTRQVFVDDGAFSSKCIQKVSGIAVLTGGRYRIAKGLDLLEQGIGQRMLISGVQDGVLLNDIAAREKVVLYDDMPIDLGYKARTTVGNAKEIAEWVDKNGFKCLYAVTSSYHTPRSFIELKRVMPEVDIYMVPVRSEYVRADWFVHWRSFRFLAVEYMKYLAVLIKSRLV